MDTIKLCALSVLIFSFSTIYSDENLELDPTEKKMLEERREVYGDPDQERVEYYEKVSPKNIPKDSDYFQKSHPIEHHGLEEDPIPQRGLEENPIPENRIPSNPI